MTANGSNLSHTLACLDFLASQATIATVAVGCSTSSKCEYGSQQSYQGEKMQGFRIYVMTSVMIVGGRVCNAITAAQTNYLLVYTAVTILAAMRQFDIFAGERANAADERHFE